jgi:hypothetical protein
VSSNQPNTKGGESKQWDWQKNRLAAHSLGFVPRQGGPGMQLVSEQELAWSISYQPETV